MKELEIRDPVHVFVRVDQRERDNLIDTEAFQRLRDIHQLALSYLLYPGACHRRFEHSLGVMELATQIFDAVTSRGRLPQRVSHSALGDLEEHSEYWRDVVRAAALCHDMGHLPFSHAAEDLLPKGWNHETITGELMLSDDFAPDWGALGVEAEDVVRVALGPEGHSLPMEPIHHLLTELITGDALGADRIDYLLRDSYHVGVAYGRFDHHRLIDSMRLVRVPPSDDQDEEEQDELRLGVDQGGIHSAEALMLARYFTFSQVYFHQVRKMYDQHLRDFLAVWLDDGQYKADLGDHIRLRDPQVLAAIQEAARDRQHPGHKPAKCIHHREHYKAVYVPTAAERQENPYAGQAMEEALVEQFGPEAVRRLQASKGPGDDEFPVEQAKHEAGGNPAWSSSVSAVLGHIPVAHVDAVCVDREVESEASRFIEENRQQIVSDLSSS